MKRFHVSFPNAWRPVGAAIAIVAGFVALYVYRLGSLPASLSSNEQQTRIDSTSLHSIVRNPLNAPYKLLEFLMVHAHEHVIAATRLPSIAVALLATIILIFLVYRWHGRRTALFAGFLFATSGWLLHVGRLGTAGSLSLLVPLGLLTTAYLINVGKYPNLTLVAFALVCGGSLFVPAGIWFVLFTIYMLRSQMSEQFKKTSPAAKVIVLVIPIVCIGLVGFSIFRAPNLLKLWIGLPAQLPGMATIIRQWLDTIVYLFIHGPSSPELWLPHIPILGIFGVGLCVIGAYFYATHPGNLRSRLLGGFALLASIFVALNGAAAMSFIVPIAYLLVATGLAFLLHEWLSVFPRNPVARIAGATLLAIAVLFTISYHVQSYFVAWRYSPVVHATFDRRP